jgi:kexin
LIWQGNGSDWQHTRAGKKFSHLYGFGKVDTYALVQRAKEWPLVKPQAWYHSPWVQVDDGIPEGSTGSTSQIEILPETLQNANLARLEHVTVTVNVNHTRRGDLSVELQSPEGMVSYLGTSRIYDNEAAGYDDWTFSTVAHWLVAALCCDVRLLIGKLVGVKLDKVSGTSSSRILRSTT